MLWSARLLADTFGGSRIAVWFKLLTRKIIYSSNVSPRTGLTLLCKARREPFRITMVRWSWRWSLWSTGLWSSFLLGEKIGSLHQYRQVSRRSVLPSLGSSSWICSGYETRLGTSARLSFLRNCKLHSNPLHAIIDLFSSNMLLS